MALAATLLIVFAAAASTAADSLLTAYPLSDQQQSDWFASTAAEKLATWTLPPPMRLAPATHGTALSAAAFTDSSDASVDIRAFHGESGLHLLITVTDDSWTAGDAVVLFLDTSPFATIAGGDVYGTYPLRTKCSFTYNTVRLTAGCAVDAAQRVVRSLYAYEVGLTRDTLTMTVAHNGPDSIHVQTGALGERTRIQQWHVPWKRFGPNGFFSPPADGQRFAFNAGYDDADGAADTAILRVTPGTDPALCVPQPGGGACLPWADIVLGKVARVLQGVRNAPPRSSRTDNRFVLINGRRLAGDWMFDRYDVRSQLSASAARTMRSTGW